MAFFSGGDDRAKLMILYILKEFRTPITREQLYTALVYNGEPGYFDMGERYAELESEGFIASVPVRNLQMLVMTEKGREACLMFEKELPKSMREALSDYANQKRGEHRRDNCIVSDAIPHPNGGYNCTFSMLERGDAQFEIRMRLPNVSYTYNAQRNWTAIADELYMQILQRLIAEPEELKREAKE